MRIGAQAVKNVAAMLVAVVLAGPAGCIPRVFNVRDYGAKGDKQANDQKAIQAAIDACAKAGGRTVRLPPGDYLSGTLRLRSHVMLYLDKGVSLLKTPSPSKPAGFRASAVVRRRLCANSQRQSARRPAQRDRFCQLGAENPPGTGWRERGFSHAARV